MVVWKCKVKERIYKGEYIYIYISCINEHQVSWTIYLHASVRCTRALFDIKRLK